MGGRGSLMHFLVCTAGQEWEPSLRRLHMTSTVSVPTVNPQWGEVCELELCGPGRSVLFLPLLMLVLLVLIAGIAGLLVLIAGIAGFAGVAGFTGVAGVAGFAGFAGVAGVAGVAGINCWY
jgi:hypothetical protein